MTNATGTHHFVPDAGNATDFIRTAFSIRR